MKAKFTYIIALLLSMLFLSSCSDLSKKRVKDEICKHYKLPTPYWIRLSTNDISQDKIKVLIDENLIVAKHEATNNETTNNSNGGITIPKVTLEMYPFPYELTEKGKKYIVSEGEGKVLLYEISFNKINSITINKTTNTAKVEYSVKNDNLTPFGEILMSNEEKMNSVINRTTYFSKIGSNWVLQSN